MTDKYAVIGNPIAHSKSPLIHKMFAGQTGQDINYEAILTPLDGFVATIERLRSEGYKGCNVTVPFKLEAFKIATELSGRAQAAQAVNTLKFEGMTIFGDNTDGIGLVTDIQHNLEFSLQGKHTLLMGTGGAAWGVTLPLLQARAHITIAYRTADKAHGLAVYMQRYHYTMHGLGFGMPQLANSYTELVGKKFDCVINATSSGLSDEMPQLPSGIFASGALAYDMMYGKETPFMKFAREQGAAIVSDGLGMLVEQAAEAFFIWRGVRPDTAPILAKLRST